MSPSIEHRENPAQYLGKSEWDFDVYAVFIDLQTPDRLTPEDFNKCVDAIIATEKLSFPYSVISTTKNFKWIGFREKLVLFHDGYDHWNVDKLLLEGGFVETAPEGAGHIMFEPPKICFWGSSQTLTRDGILTLQQSKAYKLETLPELLGRDYFTYE